MAQVVFPLYTANPMANAIARTDDGMIFLDPAPFFKKHRKRNDDLIG